jgi:hypothetical protein
MGIPRRLRVSAALRLRRSARTTCRRSAGWWAGRDLEWRERLALFPGAAQRKAQLEERRRDRLRLARALGIDAATVEPEALLTRRPRPTLPALRPWS